MSSDRTSNLLVNLEILRATNSSTGASLQPQPEMELSQSDREMLLRQQAMDKAQQGDLSTAIHLFSQLIRCNPYSASNFNNRGLLFSQNGQLQEALLDYHQALELNPRLGKVYNNRANCYAALGRLADAIDDYETAIDLDPTDMRARLNLGITLRQLGHYNEAIETFEMTLQCQQFLNTMDAVSVSSAIEGHLYAERGRTYHLMGDWNCAVGDYQRALTYLPIARSAIDVSYRLRVQVRNWLNELLSPLRVEQSGN